MERIASQISAEDLARSERMQPVCVALRGERRTKGGRTSTSIRVYAIYILRTKQYVHVYICWSRVLHFCLTISYELEETQVVIYGCL
jgi:hypothetical protein